MFIFGWLMKKAGSIFVKRGERDIDSFKQCMRVLKAGEKLIVFPGGDARARRCRRRNRNPA